MGISCGYKLRDRGRGEHESRQRRAVVAQWGSIYVIYVSLVEILLLYERDELSETWSFVLYALHGHMTAV